MYAPQRSCGELDFEPFPRRLQKQSLVLDIGQPCPSRFVLRVWDVVPILLHFSMEKTLLGSFERLRYPGEGEETGECWLHRKVRRGQFEVQLQEINNFKLRDHLHDCTSTS